jgi:hypothetical protein
VLIVMLYGITALVEEEPRFAVTWAHAGFTEYITRTGSVAPELEARFNWPTFFILSAFVTQIAGLKSVISLAAWASVFFNLLYLATGDDLELCDQDKRLVWLGVWFFYLTNWIRTIAPQALNCFLPGYSGHSPQMVQVEATPSRSLGRRWLGFGVRLANRVYLLTPVDTPNTPGRASGADLVGIVVAAYIVVASSHQLTPFFVLVSVGILVVFKRISLRSLPIVMAVIAVAWIIYMAVPFLDGHMASLTGSIGQVRNTVSANVSNRFTGSPDHLLVLNARLLMTALLGLGGLRRVRKGYWDMTLVLLAAAPFALWLQDYGGELLLRTYLFILLCRLFCCPFSHLHRPATLADCGGICLVAVRLGSFLFARYGNERMDYATHQELMPFAICTVSPFSIRSSSNLAQVSGFRSTTTRHNSTICTRQLSGGCEPGTREVRGRLFALTRSQYAYGEMFYGLPADWGERLEKDLLATGEFKVIFANDDAKIMTLIDGRNGDQP